MKNYKIEIVSFVASNDLIEYIQERITWMLENCPYDSFITLRLEKMNGGYIGDVQINAHTIKFHSHQKSDSTAHVLLLLTNDIESKLNKWKHLRFTNIKTNKTLEG